MHWTRTVKLHVECRCRSGLTLHLTVYVDTTTCPAPPMRSGITLHLTVYVDIATCPGPLMRHRPCERIISCQEKQARELAKHTRAKRSTTPSSGYHKEKDTNTVLAMTPKDLSSDHPVCASRDRQAEN